MAWPLLALLLLTDGALISIHVWLWSLGWLEAMPAFDIERQGSVPEYFNYLKWAAASLAALWLFAKRRQTLYFAWAVLFLYCLVDDAESLRMVVGAWIVDGMNWGPAFALSAQELGELAAAGIAGVILLGLLALAFFRSADESAAAFTRTLLPWLAALIFFGVVIDMVHAMAARLPTPSFWLGVVEESGEMIAASVLAGLVALYAFPATRGARLRSGERLGAVEPAE